GSAGVCGAWPVGAARGGSGAWAPAADGSAGGSAGWRASEAGSAPEAVASGWFAACSGAASAACASASISAPACCSSSSAACASDSTSMRRSASSWVMRPSCTICLILSMSLTLLAPDRDSGSEFGAGVGMPATAVERVAFLLEAPPRGGGLAAAALQPRGPGAEGARCESGEARVHRAREPIVQRLLTEPGGVLLTVASEPVIEHAPRLLARMIGEASRIVKQGFTVCYLSLPTP